MTDAEFLQAEYDLAATTPSDIVDHIPLLRALASECRHVTEMGVRTGVSTRALLVEECILRCYDIELDMTVHNLFEVAQRLKKDVRYILGNTLAVNIEETDMLFIDTDHTYKQLSMELNLHGRKVRKFLVFHDTGEPYGGALLPAIMEFLAARSDWRVRFHTPNCHGFTVLERIPS